MLCPQLQWTTKDWRQGETLRQWNIVMRNWMCVDIVCVLVLVQQLSFHCKSASARDKYRHQYRDTPWYRDTKKYRQVRDTGIVQNLYRDTTIVIRS